MTDEYCTCEEDEVDESIPRHHHVQVEASRARVDQGMAPLLELLWETGYDTQFSCEGGVEPGLESRAGGCAQPTVFRDAFYTKDHGWTGDVLGLSDAMIIFTKVQDGVAFLRNSCVKMGWPKSYDDPLWSDMMLMQVISPLKGSTEPRAVVYYASHLTKKLIEVWS